MIWIGRLIKINNQSNCSTAKLHCYHEKKLISCCPGWLLGQTVNLHQQNKFCIEGQKTQLDHWENNPPLIVVFVFSLLTSWQE